MIGEMPAARAAGMIAANEGARGERHGADAERQRIPELHAIQLGREQLAGAHCQRQAEREADEYPTEGAMQHHPDDLPAIGAERHPDADLVRALRDAVGRHAIEADGGEHQRDDAEQSREARHGAFLIE